MQNLSNKNWTCRNLAGAFAAAALLAGCSRDSVTSYETPKEDHSVRVANSSRPEAGPMGGGPMAGPHGAAGPVATVKWAALPKGWEESKEKGEMTVAKFRIDGENGNFAEVGITPLAGMARAPFVEGQIMKMWAQQLELPEPTNGMVSTPVEIGGIQGKLYDLTSTEANFQGKAKTRMMAAVAARGADLWFVKLSGAEPVVAAQQENFRQFLKSLTFEDAPGGLPAMASATETAASPLPPGGGHPDWKAPANWKEVAPGQMMVAAYEVQGSGKKAKVTVVPLGGTGGDLLSNVNRWRGQVGLGPIEEGDLTKETKTIDLADGSKATVVHAKGASQTLHGLIVPRGAQTWYYKMTGDDDVVNAEAPHLPEFAASAK